MKKSIVVLSMLITAYILINIVYAGEKGQYPLSNPLSATYVFYFDNVSYNGTYNLIYDNLTGYLINLSAGAGAMVYNSTDLMTGTHAGQFYGNNIDGDGKLNETKLSGNTAFAMWFRPKNVGSPEDSTFFSIRDRGTTTAEVLSVAFGYDQTGADGISMATNDACDANSFSAQQFSYPLTANGGWYHVVFNMNSTGQNCSLWVNGTYSNQSYNCGGANTFPACRNVTMRWGALYPSLTRSMDGMFDEMIIFNYSLSPAQIYDLYSGMYEAPTITSLNCTSCSPPYGDTSSPYTGEDETPTVKIVTSANAYCRMSNKNLSYDDMGATRNFSSGGGGATHIGTLIVADKLTSGNNSLYIACKDLGTHSSITSYLFQVGLPETTLLNATTKYMFYDKWRTLLAVIESITGNFWIRGSLVVQGLLNVTQQVYVNKNITMYSDDGNDWNCGVNNTGIFKCS